MQQCGEQFVDHNELTKNMNEIVWECIFQHCSNPKILRDSAYWMKRLLIKERHRQYVDTYANVIYKLGDRKNAIAWEQDALAAARRSAEHSGVTQNEDTMTFAANLGKMKTGEPTWEDKLPVPADLPNTRIYI